MFANVLNKGLSMVVVVAGAALTLPYLGTERFGVWMLLSSFLVLFSFLDLGMGNALTNRVGAVAAQADASRLSACISGGLGCMAIVSVISVALLCLAAVVAPWAWITRSESPEILREASVAGVALGACFGIHLLGGGLQKIYLGLQRSHEAHLSLAAGNLLALAALLIASHLKAGVPVLVMVSTIGVLVSTLALAGRLVHQHLIGFRHIGTSTRDEWQQISKVGGLFLVMQVAGVVGMGADNLVIGATLGAGQVAAYALVQRLFSFASLPAAMLNQPLWGAYAHAYATGDRPFIVKTLRGSLLVTGALTGVLVLVLAASGQFIIARWSSNTVQIPSLLLHSFAAWVLIESLAVCFSMFMNGCQLIKPQVYSSLLFCLLSVPLKFAFAAHWGLVGVVCCTILCFTLASPALYAIFFRSAIAAPLVETHGHANRLT